jgi:hypothetical protein
VYRRTEKPEARLDDPELEDKREQYLRVREFLQRLSESGGVNSYATPSEFGERFKNDVKALLRRRLESQPRPIRVETEVESADEDWPLWRGSPYPGLRAFTADEAPIFFGRGRETDQLIMRLRAPRQRFIVVVGGSGTGKSSLIRAGLLPRLAIDAIAGSRSWCVIDFTPGELGDNPFLALARALNELLPRDRQYRRSVELSAELLNAPLRMGELTEDILRDRPRWSRVVLFVDQLEELFTLVQDRYRGPFIDLLSAVASDERFCILPTLRIDFLDQFIEARQFGNTLSLSLFPLPGPGRAACTDNVRRPAELAGLELEEGLADIILEDAGAESGALPLMAFTLSELYRSSYPEVRRTRNAYERMEGLRGAISNRAESFVQELPAKAKNAPAAALSASRPR